MKKYWNIFSFISVCFPSTCFGFRLQVDFICTNVVIFVNKYVYKKTMCITEKSEPFLPLDIDGKHMSETTCLNLSYTALRERNGRN